jgi:hypothetical protein
MELISTSRGSNKDKSFCGTNCPKPLLKAPNFYVSFIFYATLKDRNNPFRGDSKGFDPSYAIKLGSKTKLSKLIYGMNS